MVNDRSESPASGGTLIRRAIDWMLVGGNRLFIAGGILVVAFVAVFAIEPYPPMTSGNLTPYFYTLSAFIGGNLNLLTIVVMINQLVLSRELRTPRKFRQDIEGLRTFRDDTRDAIDVDVASITPAGFVRELLDGTEEQVTEIERIAQRRADRELAADLDGLGDSVTDDLAAVRVALDGDSLAARDVVVALIDVDFALMVHRVDRILTEYEEDLTEAERATLERLGTQIQLLEVARDRFKQLYTRQSLADMSRVVLVVGIVTEVALAIVLLTFAGVLGGIATYLTPGVVYAAAVLGLAPLAVVFAYIMRSATVARRTATTSQFTTGAKHL